MTTQYAYGLLVLGTRDVQRPVRQQFDADAFSAVGEVPNLMEDPGSTGWGTMMGTFEWNRITERTRYVLAQALDDEPRVSNSHAKRQLADRLELAWRAAHLVPRRIPLTGRAWILSGLCSPERRPPRLRSIDGLIRIGRLPRPFYWATDGFWHALGQEEPGEEAAEWLSEWATIEKLLVGLRQPDKLPLLLWIAVLAIEAGLERPMLEFRIPDLVRAAECVLAVPGRMPKGSAKTTSREVFAERALKLVPDLARHWYVGGSQIEPDLVALYDLRSECVHGKAAFADLKSKGVAGANRAGQLEYLAQELARRSVVTAMRAVEAGTAAFSDRAQLEAAWITGAFP